MKKTYLPLLFITFYTFAQAQNQTFSTSKESEETVIEIKPDAATGKDANINSRYPTNNNKNSPQFLSQAWTWDGTAGSVRSFIDFDLSQVKPTSKVKEANLYLYASNIVASNINGHSNLTSSNESEIHLIDSPWADSTITWNNQPTFAEDHKVLLPQSSRADQDYIVDVLPLILEWLENPNTYHGFMLKLKTEQIYAGLFFCSSNHENESKHPKLRLVIEDEINSLDNNKADVSPFKIKDNGSANPSLFSTTNYQFDIFEMNGKKVKSGNVTGSFQINDLKAGIYLVNFQTGNQKATQKLVLTNQ